MSKTPNLRPEKVNEVREAIKSSISGYQGSYLKFDEMLAAQLGVTKEQVRHQRSHHMRMIKTTRGTPRKTLNKIESVATWICANHFKVTNKQIAEYCRKNFGQGMREGPITKAFERARRIHIERGEHPSVTTNHTEVYSVAEVAKKFDLTNEAIRDAVRRNRLVPDKIVSKIPLFYEQTVMAWRKSVEQFKENGRRGIRVESDIVVKKLDEILSLLRSR